MYIFDAVISDKEKKKADRLDSDNLVVSTVVVRKPKYYYYFVESYYNTNRVQGGTCRYLLESCFISKTNKMDRCDAKPNRDGH